MKKIEPIYYIYVDEFKEHIERCTNVIFYEYRKKPGIDDTFLWVAVCRYFTKKLGSEPGMMAADNVCEILNVDCEHREINKRIRSKIK